MQLGGGGGGGQRKKREKQSLEEGAVGNYLFEATAK
jgi:hypothetical protein